MAIHSVVEKLFRSIWSLPNNKAPVAIKYFFDFLDAQAESKKITDPDVVHIWKTNRYAHGIYTGVRVLSEHIVAKMKCVRCEQKSKILACLGIRCGLVLWITVTLVYWFNTTQTIRASRSVQPAHRLHTLKEVAQIGSIIWSWVPDRCVCSVAFVPWPLF